MSLQLPKTSVTYTRDEGMLPFLRPGPGYACAASGWAPDERQPRKRGERRTTLWFHGATELCFHWHVAWHPPALQNGKSAPLLAPACPRWHVLCVHSLTRHVRPAFLGMRG